MADELSNYKLQLQQVEVALLTDPENAELLKLKEDIGKYQESVLNERLLTITLSFYFQNNSLNYNRNSLKLKKVNLGSM